MKIGEKYIGWYSPQRAFVSVSVKKTQINIKCFSRGIDIKGTKVTNEKLSPRWCYFTVKKEDDIKKAIEILRESHKHILNALKAGETTGYFSGGKGSTKDMQENNIDDEEELS